MTTPSPAPIVAGVDGSAESLAAVKFAAHEAELHHTSLHLVHGFIWPLMRVPLEAPPHAPADAGLRRQAENYLARAAAAVPDRVPVTSELISGSPAAVLIAASHHAAMLVVGNRGLGGFTGMLIGSVSAQVAEHAHSPVVIFRDAPQLHAPESSALPVIVGVDDSDKCEPALEFAFSEAAARNVPLQAIHAWAQPRPENPGEIMYPVYDVAVETEKAEEILTNRLAPWREKYPDVDVHPEVVHHKPRRALIEASNQAALVVVGSRGKGGFTGLLLGSVSRALIHHAHCPVAIIRSTKTTEQ